MTRRSARSGSNEGLPTIEPSGSKGYRFRLWAGCKSPLPSAGSPEKSANHPAWAVTQMVSNASRIQRLRPVS
jgi:hypothetical protein